MGGGGRGRRPGGGPVRGRQEVREIDEVGGPPAQDGGAEDAGSAGRGLDLDVLGDDVDDGVHQEAGRALAGG